MKNENILMQVQILRGQLATIQDALKALQESIAGDAAAEIAPAAAPYGSGHARIVATLQGRAYPVTIHTIARETGLQVGTIHTYLTDLREQGVKIETTRRGYSRPRYRLYGGA